MKIKTKYIKDKIKELNFSNFKDRQYIKDLLYIERLLSIDAQRWGYAGAMKLGFLKEEHCVDYHEIYEELDPKGHKKEYENETDRRKERNETAKRLRQIQDKEDEEFKKEWKKAGGRE